MPPPPRGRVVALALAVALMGLDAGSFGPAVPALRAGLGLDDPRAAWLLSAHVVGTLLGNPGNAWVNARWGPARALALGLAVYAVGALAMSIATDIVFASAARGLQGLGAGSLLAVSTGTLAASAAPAHRGRAIMLLSLAYAVAFLGASVAGSLFAAAGWRVLYGGLAAVALFAAVLTTALLGGDPTLRPTAPAPLDARGFGLWAVTVAALAVVVPQLKGGAVGGGVIAAALLVAAGGVAASVAHARRVAQPFVPLQLPREPAVRAACVLAAAAGAGQVFAVSLPSFAAVVVGIDAAHVGVWSLPFVLTGLVGMAGAAFLLDRAGARRVVVACGAVFVVGGAALVVAPGERLPFALATALVGAGVCTLSGGPIRHLVPSSSAADNARAQALLALVTNLGLLAGSAVYGALASADPDVLRRAEGMRVGTALVTALVAVGLVAGLAILPRRVAVAARASG